MWLKIEEAGCRYLLTRHIFTTLWGVIYLFAIVSLLLQIDGLIGSHGILPLHEFLDVAQARLGTEAYR